jgi:hypothetical protein
MNALRYLAVLVTAHDVSLHLVGPRDQQPNKSPKAAREHCDQEMEDVVDGLPSHEHCLIVGRGSRFAIAARRSGEIPPSLRRLDLVQPFGGPA